MGSCVQEPAVRKPTVSRRRRSICFWCFFFLNKLKLALHCARAWATECTLNELIRLIRVWNWKLFVDRCQCVYQCVPRGQCLCLEWTDGRVNISRGFLYLFLFLPANFAGNCSARVLRRHLTCIEWNRQRALDHLL